MRIIRSVNSFIVVAACGGNSGPTEIAITTENPPALVAFRSTPTGAWDTSAALADASFKFPVTGPYQVVIVCDDGVGDITTYRLARTPGDDPTFDAPCDPTNAVTSNVTGTMNQAGQVSVGFSTSLSSSAPWDFNMVIADGSYDLIAANTDHILIKRDFKVAGDTAVTPAIDVVQQGMALVTTPLTVSNTKTGEVPTTRVSLTTASTFASISHAVPASALLVPSGLLVDTDEEFVVIEADDPNDATLSRFVTRTFKQGSSTAFALPDPITPVTFAVDAGTLQASWTTMPDFDSFDVSAFAFPDDFSSFWFDDATVSASYIAATGDTSVAMPTDIPGYQAAWKIDYTKEYNRAFQGSNTDGDTTAGATFDEDVNAPAARKAVSRKDLAMTRARLSRITRARN